MEEKEDVENGGDSQLAIIQKEPLTPTDELLVTANLTTQSADLKRPSPTAIRHILRTSAERHKGIIL